MHKSTAAIIGILLIPLVATALFIGFCATRHHHDKSPLKHTATATVFWVGEAATAENAFIPNDASAWDGQWRSHFGGVDTPDSRQQGGDWPAGFAPKENPFYVALPYSEFDDKGRIKPTAKLVPWFSTASPPNAGRSILKNHWVKIRRGDRTAYAQWEDVGPMNTDDFGYVFGNQRAAYKPAGIDLSPATAHRLGITEKATVTWEFVDSSDVPTGPWTRIVTSSQMSP